MPRSIDWAPPVILPVLRSGGRGAIPWATRPELKYEKGQPRAVNMWQWTRSVCRQTPRGLYPGKLPACGNRTGWSARRRPHCRHDCRPPRVGKEDVGSASGPACAVLRWCGPAVATIPSPSSRSGRPAGPSPRSSGPRQSAPPARSGPDAWPSRWRRTRTTASGATVTMTSAAPCVASGAGSPDHRRHWPPGRKAGPFGIKGRLARSGQLVAARLPPPASFSGS